MNNPLPNRQSIRLKNYDYSQPGYYFVTICTQSRQNRFGGIVDGHMQLNPLGEIVTEQWNELGRIRDSIRNNPKNGKRIN